MANIIVSAPKVKREMTVSFDMPTTIEAMEKAWGKEKVAALAYDAAVIAFQGFVRNRMMRAGDKRMTDAQIVTDAKTWKPGERVASDPQAKANNLIRSMNGLDDAALAALGMTPIAIKNIRDKARALPAKKKPEPKTATTAKKK